MRVASDALLAVWLQNPFDMTRTEVNSKPAFPDQHRTEF